MRSSTEPDVIVIGAGHNGLTAACYLARAGLDVLVLEASDEIGGMTNTRSSLPEAPEHRLNLCAIDATFIRASGVVEDLGLHRFGYRERLVDPAWAVVDPDGGSIALWRDPRRTAAEIRRFSRRDADAFLEFSRLLDAFLDVAGPLWFTNPVRPEPRAVLATAWSGIRNVGRMIEIPGMFSASGAQVIDERFRHPMVKGLLASMASVVAPVNSAGTGMPLTVWGWYQRHGNARILGGTQGLPLALSACLAAAGGRIRTSSRVDALLVRGDQVRGVRLADGEELRASTVVAGCDPHQTLTRLLPAGTLPERLERRAAHISSSKSVVGFKVDMALSGRLEMSRHHAWRDDDVDLRTTILCQGTFDEQVNAAEQVAAGRMPDFLPYTITVPTAVDPSQAPEGQDTVYIYAAPVPFSPPEPWNVLGKRASDAVVQDAGQYLDGLGELEIARSVEAWPGIAERTLATNGSWHHVDIGLMHMGPLRPAIGLAGYRTPVGGLYLTGAGTHPGSGISGMPGKLTARTVLKVLRKG